MDTNQTAKGSDKMNKPNVTTKRGPYPGAYLVTNVHGDTYEVERMNDEAGNTGGVWWNVRHATSTGLAFDSFNTLGDAKWVISGYDRAGTPNNLID